MANFITVGGEFINLDKVCHISVYTNTDGTVITEIEYERAIKEIPCAGTEDEVRNEVRWAIRQALDIVPTGPTHISETT
jgi:hypothetical protein